ncbi:hypothetical protein BLOT_010800 [Blomia tropicalis]|nr:hypothetical protein BLOT_010800 [Blomia tropicalis]
MILKTFVQRIGMASIAKSGFTIHQQSLNHRTRQVLTFRTDRRYSEKHEWVTLDANDKSIGTIGISNYAQEALGDVVYVQAPEIGSEHNQDDEVGAVESVKAANEIYTPLSGTILEVNQALDEKPGLINSSCYDEGWIFKIKIKDPKEVDGLMDEKAYEQFLKSAH